MRRGVTLVEVLVTVIVLAIITGVVVAVPRGGQDTASDTLAQAHLEAAAAAQQAALSTEGRLADPETLSSLNPHLDTAAVDLEAELGSARAAASAQSTTGHCWLGYHEVVDDALDTRVGVRYDTVCSATPLADWDNADETARRWVDLTDPTR